MKLFGIAFLLVLLLTASNPNTREGNIQAAERGIRLLPYEVALVFDHDGRQLFSWRGDDHSIAVPDAALDSLKDDILTHNHPGYNTTFSPDDYQVAWRGNLAQLRVVSTDERGRGTLCVFDRGQQTAWPRLADRWSFVGKLAEVSSANDRIWRRWAKMNDLVYFCEFAQ